MSNGLLDKCSRPARWHRGLPNFYVLVLALWSPYSICSRLPCWYSVFEDHCPVQNTALVAIFAFACSAGLGGSSLASLTLLSAQPSPRWVTLSIRSSVSVMVLGCGQLQGWFQLTSFPWNLPAGPCIFTGTLPIFDGTKFPKLIYWP